MKTAQLSGSTRENVGKKEAAALRKAGKVPAVLYGAGEQTHFSVDALPMSKLVITPNVYKIELDINGTKKDAIIQDIQFHPVTDDIIHVDFLELQEGKPVKVALPLRFTGNAIGVRNGGKLLVNFRKLNVFGLAKDMPEDISLDITNLRIGKSLRIKDINLEGLKLLHDQNAVAVMVKMARGAVDSDDDEEEGEGEEATAEASAE